MRKILAAFLGGALLLAFALPAVSATQVEKFYVCHAAGLEGTTHYETLHLPLQGYATHLDPVTGTPQAGHEDDYAGECVEESEEPSGEPSSEPSVTPSPTPTPEVTPTPTPTPSEDPSEEPTPSPTPSGSASSTEEPGPTLPPTDTEASSGSVLNDVSTFLVIGLLFVAAVVGAYVVNGRRNTQPKP